MGRTHSCKRVLFVQSKTIMFYNLQTNVEEKGLMLLQLKGFFFFAHKALDKTDNKCQAHKSGCLSLSTACCRENA